MTKPTNYIIFWLPSGYTYEPAGSNANYEQLIEEYLYLVSGTPYYNVLSQYYSTSDGNIQNGEAYGAAYVDTNPYPPTQSGCSAPPGGACVLDSAVQQEVSRDMAAEGWTGGLDHEFFVFTGYDVQGCIDDPRSINHPCSYTGGYCGYHSYFQSQSGQPNVYAVLPDIETSGSAGLTCDAGTSPNKDMLADSRIHDLSHEQVESVTDPEVGGDTAWYACGGGSCTGTTDGEVADLCKSQGQSVTLNGFQFVVESIWSDAVGSCSTRLQGTTLSVNVTADLPAPCQASAYSLRCAIIQANSDAAGDTIAFDIPSSDAGCKPYFLYPYSRFGCTITPASPLPALTAGGTTVAGYTQAGARRNTGTPPSDNALLTVGLDGSNLGQGFMLDGLTITGSTDTVQGLSITNFASGYGIFDSHVGNRLQGNMIGTLLSGQPGPNGDGGVWLYNGAYGSTDTVGGASPAEVNVISNNGQDGLDVAGGSGDVVMGNIIATNSADGVFIGGSSAGGDAAHVAINQNAIYGNAGLGIGLNGQPPGACVAQSTTSGAPNDFMPCPTITSVTTSEIQGSVYTVFNHPSVEVFVASDTGGDSGHGQGMTYLGTARADLGGWTLQAPFAVPLQPGQSVTATVTYAVGGFPSPLETSQFAANVAVSSPTDARVIRLHVSRHGSHLACRWRVATTSGIAGFNLYAGGHRLNRRLIPSLRNGVYVYRARWSRPGPFDLRVILTNGQQLSLGAK